LEEKSINSGIKSVRRCARTVVITLLLGIISVANAEDNYPLRPPDASSPRATLNGFIAITDDIYRRMKNILEAYADSDRLYLTAEERRQQLAALGEAPNTFHYLDLSGTPPVLKDTVSAERVLQLKEILDRIEIPQIVDVPDKDAMAREPTKRWRLPNTEIDIVRIENGPRAGEYLVSAETVERLPEFYQRVKELPYKPGPGEQLASVYRRLSHDETATIYQAFLSSPVGVSFIFPPRWLLSLPNWAKLPVAGLAAWQWLGLIVGSLTGGLIIWLGYRATWHPDDGEDAARPHWRVLLLPLAIIFVAGILTPFFDKVLRTGGNVRIVIDYTRTAAVFVGTAWLAIAAFAVLGETIVESDRLTIRSLDSQLIRLGTRLVGIVAAVAILIEGGDELGFPAYSVLAGLGVGGLAVALAAQSTIANLIGSLLIALEKPFRVGQYVRIGTSEGTVEDVGFRSTRIRTPDNSLVSIPSSTVVNTTVENLSLRAKRRQRFVVQVTYNTPREKLQELVVAIKQLLAQNPLVEESTCHVRVYNLGESSLDILVIFHLEVADYASELMEREAVLLQIMALADEAGVEFAFPTRTLHIENSAQNILTWPKTDEPARGFGGRN
jgi:MscS family membrane protein